MTDKNFDLLAIGNPIVDILVKTDDAFLESLGLIKGSMNIMNKKAAHKIFGMFNEIEKSTSSNVNEMSGGCAANVAAGISSFNAKAAFIGKLGHDSYGNRFISKLEERKVEMECSIHVHGGDTGRCMIVVTPDGCRTMCTYTGSGCNINENEIKEKEAMIAASKMVFISAFLWDGNSGQETVNTVVEIAKKNNTKIALSLADVLCVRRHKKALMEAVDDGIDFVFANKNEINELLSSKSHEDSVKAMTEKYAGKEKIAALTCSADGAIIVNKDGATAVKGEKVDKVVDSTGSGALFVSGFLYGQMQGLDIEKSARLGNMAAAECLVHLGARPITPLSELFAKV